MRGRKSRVVALAAVGGCFLAFWAPASAQGPAEPAPEAARVGPETASAVPEGESPAESAVVAPSPEALREIEARRAAERGRD